MSLGEHPADDETCRQAEWDEWLRWRAWRRRAWRRRLLVWGLIGLIWAAVVAGLLLVWFLRDLPRPESALDAVRKPSLMVKDAAGNDIATYGDVVGEPLRLADIPAFLPQAAVAIEDRRFWEHGGLDPRGILRAIFVDLRDRRVAQGGSTITQQVAKTLFLSNARTWRRKLQELVLTQWLAHSFTRQEILEIWLNRVYLGQGAWGVDAAAHVYFGISARQLSLWQCAMLTGLPRAPSRYNPRADPTAAVARTREVLHAMVANGNIGEAQAQAAVQAIDTSRVRVQGGWFADWVAGTAPVPADTDAVLRTTLDLRTQAAAERALAAILARDGARLHVTQGAAVVLDAQTGAVRAMVGGRDYAASSYNRAVMARRQAGSSFKPFVWLAALEHGVRPDDTVEDAPVRIGGYAPEDFTHRYLGPITVEEALALSVNTAAVRLLLRAGGARAVAAVAHRLGIADRLPDNASLALGTGSVGLLEMAGAYASFCNGGVRVTPWGVGAMTLGGVPRVQTPPAPSPSIEALQAEAMERMLKAVVVRGTGTRAAIAGREVIGKTGTTQDYHDAWFIGCIDRHRVVGTWLGNDDGSGMRGVEGGSLPAEWFRAIGSAG